MLVDANFDEVADQFEPGEYSVRVVGGKPGEWKTGTKHVAWELETFDEVDPKNNSRKIFYRTPIHGKGAFMLQRLYLAAMGEPLVGGSLDTEQLLTKEIKIVVIDGRDKEGNLSGYPEIKSVKSL